MLLVAATFLTHDYEYSLRISSGDFSFLAPGALFEGNILRFRALASMEIFHDSLEQSKLSFQEDVELRQENFSFLTSSIASLENSNRIFEAR